MSKTPPNADALILARHRKNVANLGQKLDALRKMEEEVYDLRRQISLLRKEDSPNSLQQVEALSQQVDEALNRIEAKRQEAFGA